MTVTVEQSEESPLAKSRPIFARNPLSPQQRIILVSLALLTVGAWAVTIDQARSTMGMGLTMGLSGPVFLGIWIVMMAAMMFPSAAPMILTFSRVSEGNRARGRSFVPTWCWLLFAILFPLGMMNIAAMAVVALLVFLEKTAFTGPLFSRVLGASLCAFGLLVLAAPNVLPQKA